MLSRKVTTGLSIAQMTQRIHPIVTNQNGYTKIMAVFFHPPCNFTHNFMQKLLICNVLILTVHHTCVKKYLFIIACLYSCFFARAQAGFPKREFRAVWIATVDNIDWPSRPGLPSDEQKREFITILNRQQRNGMNAVVVQIRPAADAFYPSTLEPWSQWLSGRQGLPPFPYYDPLQFMIEETHKRGMEFHAWFNPYRAVFNVNTSRLAPNHITRLRPQWFLTYGDKKYFDPGIPEVWTFVTHVIRDVVRRYDIDAVHFDDYFYPYRIPGKEFPDHNSYRLHGHGMEKAAWRRHNVDTIIQLLNTAIKEEKPWVKFGISPFGVWRNAEQDPDGSPTKAGQTNYDDLYADVLKWLRNGWIDYVAPQLYWEMGHPLVAYEILLDWWSKHTYGRHLYIGQGLYRIGSNARWKTPRELPDQLIANRSYHNVQGSIFFSARSFTQYTYGFEDSLQNHFYKYPALPPTMPWIDSIPPSAPQLLNAREEGRALCIQWKNTDTTGATSAYVVYRFEGDTLGNLNDPTHILSILPAGKEEIFSYQDTKLIRDKLYIYCITALDRLHNESLPSQPLRIQQKRKKGADTL